MYSPHLTVAKVCDMHLFTRTRARMRRNDDLKAYCGWMLEFGAHSAAIQVKGDARDIRLGDRFAVEVTGKEKTAVFIAEAVAANNGLFSMALPRGAVALPKKGDARVALYGFHGMVTVEGEPIPFTLSDMSENGLGILVDIARDIDGPVSFELVTPVYKISGNGAVRYSRPDPYGSGRQIVGIRVHHANRVDKARWHTVMSMVWER